MNRATGIRTDTEQLRRLRYVTRLNEVHDAVHGAVTLELGQPPLPQEICRILVEVGSFRMAWFGVPDDQGWIVPQAMFGDTQGYIKTIRVSMRDIPEGRCPTGGAIREKRPVICNHILTDPALLPWRVPAARCGFTASASFPVPLSSGEIAALTLYAIEEDFFSTTEELLVTRICTDIGCALQLAALERSLAPAQPLRKSR